MGTLDLWFSYETPIAFWNDGEERVVRKNQWGPTTGRHLNAVDGGSKAAVSARIDTAEFEAQMQMILSRFEL